MQVLKNFLNRKGRKPQPVITRVQTSDQGFEVLWEHGKAEAVKWSEVNTIFTYKIDCFAYDVIYLGFERHGIDGTLHICEETEGFPELMSALGKVFPSVNPEWYSIVMHPAFAENFTILFERPNEA